MINQVRHAGYTLIEILVVIFIISIVSSVALLSIGRNENKQVESFANELMQVVTLAEEQAMLQPQVLGLTFEKKTVQFSSYELASDAKTNKWVPLQDTVLGQHKIPTNVQVRMDTGSGSQAASQIVISTNGDVTPFKIYVGVKGQKPRYVIMGDADGSVTKKLLT